MAPLRKKKVSNVKLDALLRQGAANKRVDIDRAIVNSTDRLLKERIVFTKSQATFDSMGAFRNDKLTVLDPLNEAKARQRMEPILKKCGKKTRNVRPVQRRKRPVKQETTAPAKGTQPSS